MTDDPNLPREPQNLPEFLAEADSTPEVLAKWRADVRSKLESKLVKSDLEKAGGTSLTDDDLVDIRNSAFQFAIDHLMFRISNDAVAFNERLAVLSKKANVLYDLLTADVEDPTQTRVLDFLYSDPERKKRLNQLRDELKTLVDRSGQIKQSTSRGRKPIHGPELESLVKGLRNVWKKSGGRGAGAYWDPAAGEDTGGLLALLRLTVSQTRAALNEVTPGAAALRSVSDATLSDAIDAVAVSDTQPDKKAR